MTQPNDYTPDDAANASSLAAYAAKTQDDWRAEIQQPYQSTFGGILSGLWGGLVNAGSFALSIISEVVRAILGLDPTTFFVSIEQALSSLTHFFGQIINGFVGIFSGAVGVAGKTVSDIFTSIGGFFGSFLSGLTGTSAVKAPIATAWDVHIGADGIRQTVANLQSEVQALKFDQLPPGGIRYVDAGPVPYISGWGPDWTAAPDNTGTVCVTNTGFRWIDSGSVQRLYRARYSAGKTDTDKQVAGMVLWTLMEGPASAATAGCGNYLFARLSDDWQSFIYLRLYYNKIELGCYSDGVQHIWDTVLGTPATASLWEIQAGTEDDDYEILVYQNRQTICDYKDEDHVSKVGEDYRSGGMGMISDARPGAESTPGGIAQWSLRDLAPPAIIGTGMRVRNVDTVDTYSIPGGGLVSSVPNAYFDDVNYCSADIDWDAATTTATISTEGFYQIEFMVLFSTWYSSVTLYPAMIQNSDILGINVFGSAGTQSQVRSCSGSFTTYCRPGDVLSPAVAVLTAGSISVTGDSLGQTAWLTITKVG